MKDKKQTMRLAALCVVVALCVGYAVVKVTGGKPKPQKTVTAQAEKTSPNVGSGAGPGEVSGDAATVQPSAPTEQTLIASNLRDPFVPYLVSDVGMPSAAPRVATGSGRRPQVPLVAIPAGLVPPIGAGAASGQQPGTQPREPEPFPPFVVTGCVTGSQNVAIIRLGEGRHIVKEGQRINGTYQVVSVSLEGVLLSRDGRSVFLRLGGEGNASKS